MSQVPSQVVLVNEPPAWLSVQQAAAYCGVEYREMYERMLRNLETRRICVRGGASPFGRLIRVERDSLLRLRGEAPDVPSAELPAHPRTHCPRTARRTPDRRHKAIRIDRESLLQLGRYSVWRPALVARRYITVAEAAEYLQISDPRCVA
jgi:hypothetical protein